jgi:hypothetical protein
MSLAPIALGAAGWLCGGYVSLVNSPAVHNIEVNSLLLTCFELDYYKAASRFSLLPT